MGSSHFARRQNAIRFPNYVVLSPITHNPSINQKVFCNPPIYSAEMELTGKATSHR
jgi:hypothetical protein